MEKLARGTSVEIITPKTVPLGLIAVATVCHVNDKHVKVQITGGITCLVEPAEVSKVYSKLVKDYNRKLAENPSNKNLKAPPKLTNLFKRGEQYICKILDTNTRKNNPNAQHVCATFDPSAILDDIVPTIYLAIPNVPIQCVVKTIEDHGYQMDVGIKNVTGFLKFSDMNDSSGSPKQLIVGRVVRCCLLGSITMDEGTRSIPLTMCESELTKSNFCESRVSECHLNERCILPGSKSFCTVISVKNEGLLVNLMNEFSGFVTADNLKSEWDVAKDKYQISDKFECTILYYNPNTNAFSLTLRPSKRLNESLKYIMKKFTIGQTIENAKVAQIAGTRGVYFKLDDDYKALGTSKDLLESDPGALTKAEVVSSLEENYPIGSKQDVRVKSINLADRIIGVGSKLMVKEAKIRQIENELMDPNKVPQSIHEFERLVLKSPNSGEVWTKYSKYFLDNVETDKARIVCRRALKTINFRQEKEKLRVWLHLIKIEAKYGGRDRLRATIAEAVKLNDPLQVYSRAAKMLTNINELEEADRIYELMLKLNSKTVDNIIDYIEFLMENMKNMEKARLVYDRFVKGFSKANLLNFQSRFARLEFKCGDVERGKTIFENILNENPKKVDIWRVYKDMIRKFGTRLVDNEQIREQNEETLKRISESIDTISSLKSKPRRSGGNKRKKVRFE